MLGGFTNYAHLRLRDHRPGNGDYELPPGFGPKSSSSKRSIFARHYVSVGSESCSAGPGAYLLPTTIGRGRSTRFARQSSDRSGSAAKESAGQLLSDRSLPVAAPPKQYSMALCPDTPSYSLCGRLKSAWDQQSTHASPGPAAYVVPGYFDTLDPEHQQHPWSGLAPGVHLGIRTVLPESREKEGVPGPGAYNLVRFGDELPRTREPLVIRCSRRGGGVAETPGPGAYDDPTSIGYRADQVRIKRLLTQSSTFGGRWRKREFHTPGPGPAAYNTLTATKLLEKNQRHSPRFVRRHPALDRQSVAEAAAAHMEEFSGAPALHSFPTLPSDFDFDFRKGKTIDGRRHESLARLEPSPSMTRAADDKPSGSRAFWEPPPPPGGRFAATPYDPSAQSLAAKKARADAARLSEGANSVPGPGSYNVEADLMTRRVPASLFGRMLSAKSVSAENGVPGPGQYRLVDETDSRGTLFYKGDFHPRGCSGQGRSAEESLGVGPGAHYNDDTMYSCSINGDRANNKGYTMGIRYPARATYQYCAPYDKTTNINCVYEDELNWEVRPSQHLPPVRRGKQ
ncbi:hypothetical protein LPMP_340390 [Leishmania panamensis]|uniref:Sperm-tail PG-rich repeat-containing protein 2 n=1 Tax=Leishmania panamensis TaxID=5679 RepID=A0A088RZY2_LEIPA|nr:hypothetical protein LPMP_340390 [Leishmania panamensis]AIO01668.1 hypothetical protein LPMP_340390 [Leishmania panamensis]